jgi:hypothetical protein
VLVAATEGDSTATPTDAPFALSTRATDHYFLLKGDGAACDVPYDLGLSGATFSQADDVGGAT